MVARVGHAERDRLRGTLNPRARGVVIIKPPLFVGKAKEALVGYARPAADAADVHRPVRRGGKRTEPEGVDAHRQVRARPPRDLGHGVDRALDPHEDVVERLEELEQVRRQERGPRLAEIGGREAAAAPPALDRVEREELVRVVEDGQEKVVVLLQLERGARGPHRLGDARRARDVARQLVDLAGDVERVELDDLGNLRARRVDRDVLELVERAVADEVSHLAHRHEEDVADPT